MRFAVSGAQPASLATVGEKKRNKNLGRGGTTGGVCKRSSKRPLIDLVIAEIPSYLHLT